MSNDTYLYSVAHIRGTGIMVALLEVDVSRHGKGEQCLSDSVLMLDLKLRCGLYLRLC